MYKCLFFLLVCIKTSFLHASASTLIVGTNAEFPPFSYIDNNEIIGFDIDVAKEVASKLGKGIQFKDMPFDALIPEITLGHVDFVAAGMSYTEERAKRVLFTEAYVTEDPLVIFTSAEKPLSLDQLHGKTVVVVEGFNADFFMSAQSDVHLIRLPTQTDGFMAIKSKRADAFVTAKSTVNAFFERQDPALFHTNTIEGTGETCALIVPKNKPDMLLNLQNALDEMKKDGSLAKLKTKWNLP